MAWVKVKEGSAFCRWSVKYHDDKVLSLGSPMVGKSPLPHSSDISTLGDGLGQPKVSDWGASQLSQVTEARNPNPEKCECLCVKSI